MISHVNYSIINQGLLSGVQAFMIYITDGVGDEANEAVDAILKIRSFNAPGCKLVLFKGKFTPENSEDIYSMVKSLTDAGFVCGATSDGRVFYPWMTMLKFNSVMPEKGWMGYEVQEFTHNLVFGTKPQLPPNPEKTALFILGADDALAAFMRNSPLSWRVLGMTNIDKEL